MVYVHRTSDSGCSIKKRFDVSRNFEFNFGLLCQQACAPWRPILGDLKTVVGAVEFADRSFRRPTNGWGRQLRATIPVSDYGEWNREAVVSRLRNTLNQLTGDSWNLTFYKRKTEPNHVSQLCFALDPAISAVIPYSDGLDSYSVYVIERARLGDEIAKVRVQNRVATRSSLERCFTPALFRISTEDDYKKESSYRSRAFKFLAHGAIMAYLASAKSIIVPESGQSSFYSVLVRNAMEYPHYGSHPEFTRKMELFLNALLGTNLRIETPQLWFTKG